MGLDRRMQCFTDQLFPIIWSRYLIPVELTYRSEPSGLKFKEISPALIELLSKAIWVQSKIAFHHWVRYLRKYYDEMVSSPKMFVMYVTYACNTMGYNIQDHYERFVTVCSLLVGFGANFYYSGNGEVLRYIPQILAVFFERVLLVQFYDRGGWKRLDKYLLRQEYLNWHDEIQIECPNETPQQKVTRELNFAKKVEVAILASACKDYDADFINEKDVECDLVAVQITDEVMRYFSETSPKKKGLKKLKSSATSQPFDEADIEAKKNVAKGMMELVQRARLDALLKSRRLEESSAYSGIASNIPFSEATSNAHLETEIMKQPDSIKRDEPASKRQKTKKRKVSKTKSGVPNIPQFIEKTYEASVESGGAVSNIIKKTEIIVIQKPDTRSEDSASKLLKTKKQKASKVKDSNLHSSPLSVEKIKKIMHSDFGDSNESVNPAHKHTEINNDSISWVTAEGNESTMKNLKSTEKVNEDKCIENIKGGKLCIAKKLSNSTKNDNSENLRDSKCTSNHAAITGNNQPRISDIPESNGSSYIQKKSKHEYTEQALQDKETKSAVSQESIANNNEQKSVNIAGEETRAVSVSCIVRGSTDVSLDSKAKENGSVSDHKQSIERNMNSETLEDNIPKNNTSSNTSHAKFKTKREAMNSMIKVVDNLAPKIEMFVVMLDSLVWDLKKDS